MGRFQVLFSGEVAEGAAESAVRQNLVRRLGLDERKVSQLFSGRTVVIRSDLTRDAADELQAELAGLGAIARIKDISPDEKAKFKIDKHVDQTLKDITAAHHECPRCGHMQLESEFCARCGIDIATAAKQKRKEDLLIEKKIKGLKVGQKPGAGDGAGAAERAAGSCRWNRADQTSPRAVGGATTCGFAFDGAARRVDAAPAERRAGAGATRSRCERTAYGATRPTRLPATRSAAVDSGATF